VTEREDEEQLLRSVALQNAKAILLARQRAEQGLLQANEALELKTAELAQSLAMLRATLESTTDGILVTDAAGCIIGFNEKYVSMWGIPRALMSGGTHQALLEVIAQQFTDSPRFLDRVHAIYATAPPESYDLLELADARVFERFSRPQFVDGRNVGRVWSFRDITQERRTQELLRRESERFRITLSSIGDAVISTDAQGRVTFLNRVAETLTGWTHREAVGRSLDEVFHIVNHNTRIPVESPALRALREGRVVGLANHTVLISRDGVERPIDDSAAPILDAAGATVGAVLVFRDVTDRMQAHDAMARLAAIVQSSQDAIISKSLDGTIQSWNREAERLFGYSAEEAIGQRIGLIIPPDRADEERGIMERLRRGERVEHIETVRVAKDGRPVELSITISPIRNAAGHVIGASKVARDIAERKKIEAALQTADRRKDEFLAVLAHELRNPLAPLANGLQVIRLAQGNPDAIGRARTMMERQLAHLVRLVDDLLDVSRINRNKMELRRSRLLLADVLNNAIETARPLIEAAEHTLTVSLPPEPINVDGDLTRLSQVFSNLLANSAKYTEAGGHIFLQAARGPDHVVVSVRDTGIGIPAEHVGRVFDMFSQVDRSIERSSGGLGIGLALVDGLVKMHGGMVSAQSPGPGQGSTFTVTLPIIEADAPHMTPGLVDQSLMAQAKHRILVVDDHLDATTSMAMMLEFLGSEVRTAHDGLQAIEEAERYRPDVVLMDVGMPRLNGYEATRRIRAQAWGRDLLIIALTGWGQEDDKARSHEAGCDGHLTKPVSLTDLESLLGTLKSGRDPRGG
jgi:PAS domain S-box-containing protein